jgi:hypothetical protein
MAARDPYPSLATVRLAAHHSGLKESRHPWRLDRKFVGVVNL